MSKPLCLLTLAATAAGCLANREPEVAEVADALATAFCEAKPIAAFNTPGDEGRLVFSPDGKHAMWHRESAATGLEIVESHFVHGYWTPAQRPSFTSPFTEFDPYIALDGKTVYYTSFRPLAGTVQRPDGDIWKVERTPGGWTAPVHLGPNVNTDDNEFFPSQTADGTLLWNSDRDGGAGEWDLWRAKGSQPAAPLPGDVNTEIWEFNPSPTPGGRLLAFGSLDPDPLAPYSDVFFSVRVGNNYSGGINAGPCVNTELEEYHPTLDWARGRLIFVRRNVATNGDFYEAPLPAVLLALLQP